VTDWRSAELVATRRASASAADLTFAIGGWTGHRPGQHVDVRLTAEDGYQSQRSYSIASAPRAGSIDLAVERIDDGEVSPYLAQDMQPGDVLELRGPLGGWFVWDVADGGPLWLIAGGSGVVPLMAMLRGRAAAGSDVPARLLLSARAERDVFWPGELRELAARGDGFELTITLTREAPPGWDGLRGRVNKDVLADVGWAPAQRPRVYVCGPTGFVEGVAGALVELGHDPALVRTERFGPTG
jgi:ferredoxin-NADP reductase